MPASTSIRLDWSYRASRRPRFATAGDTISAIDWYNVGDNLDDEGKDAEIVAAAGPRYCAVASLR